MFFLYSITFPLFLLLASSLFLAGSIAAPLIILAFTLMAFALVNRLSVIELIEGILLFNVIFLLLYFPIFGWGLSHASRVDVQLVQALVGLRSAIGSVLLMLAFVLVAHIREPVRGIKLTLMAYLFFLLLSLALFELNLVTGLGNLLNSLIPVALLPAITAFYFGNARRGFKRFYVLSVLWLLTVFAVLYAILLPYLYELVRPDIIGVIRSKGGVELDFGEYPGSWASRIGDFRFRRLVGSAPDPIIFGYFLSAFAIFCLAKKQFFRMSGLLCLCVLAGSKGALLFFVTVFVLSITFRINRHLFVPVAVVILSVSLYTAAISDSSSRVHFAGLVGALNSILDSVQSAVFGYGIGSGGNLGKFSDGAVMMEASMWHNNGAESGVGVLSYQLGFSGAFLILMLYRQCWSCIIKFQHRQSPFLLSMLAALFINSFLQENCVNFSMLGIVFLFMLLISSEPDMPSTSDSCSRDAKRSKQASENFVPL